MHLSNVSYRSCFYTLYCPSMRKNWPDIGQGPVPRKMVKFKPVLSQILSIVFSSKNMQLEVTIYCLVFTTRYSNNSTKCYPKQCIGM